MSKEFEGGIEREGMTKIYLSRMEAHSRNVCLCHNGIVIGRWRVGVKRKTNEGGGGDVWGRQIPTNDAPIPPPIPRRRAEIYRI